MPAQTTQPAPADAIGAAHAAAVAILSATGRDLFETSEVAEMLDRAEAALTDTDARAEPARDELVRRVSEGRVQLEGSSFISASRAQDIALDCWGPLETLLGRFN